MAFGPLKPHSYSAPLTSHSFPDLHKIPPNVRKSLMIQACINTLNILRSEKAIYTAPLRPKQPIIIINIPDFQEGSESQKTPQAEEKISASKESPKEIAEESKDKNKNETSDRLTKLKPPAKKPEQESISTVDGSSDVQISGKDSKNMLMFMVGFREEVQQLLLQQVKFSQQMQRANFSLFSSLPQGMSFNNRNIFLHFATLEYCLNNLKEQIAALEGKLAAQGENKPSQTANILKKIEELHQLAKILLSNKPLENTKEAALFLKKQWLSTLILVNDKLLALQSEFNELLKASLPNESIPEENSSIHLSDVSLESSNTSKSAEKNPETLQNLKNEKELNPSNVKLQEKANISQMDISVSDTISSNKNEIAPSLLLIKNAAELSAKIQIFYQKNTDLPLTFIVPYPFASKSEAPLSKGAKNTDQSLDQDVEEDSEGGGVGGSERKQAIVFVPAGPVILGDPFKEGRKDELAPKLTDLPDFLIAATSVTNLQFCNWLNGLFKSGNIVFSSKGEIKDEQSRILALTSERTQTSQIQIQVSQGQIQFKPTPGMEYHPVVHVTYYGAEAFCKSNGMRLPTEAEWEKAAGMAIPHENEFPLKFRYGFSSNEIDLSYANYSDTFSVQTRLNLTLPIGFYNGQTVFNRVGKTIQTKNAISPYGCYDMSGNVRQWTSDWYEAEKKQKIVKGGSYVSSAFDLRVAARTPLYPDTADAFTGFRVALDV